MLLPNCVIPIHKEKRGRLESFGSGVLLRALEYRMMVSAAHVLLDDPLWLPGKPRFVPLDSAGRVFATCPDLDAAKKDRADLAYTVLEETAAEALEAQGCEFLSIAQTSFGKAFPRPERWIFSGYPWRKSNNRVVGQIVNTRMDVMERAIPDEDLADFDLDARLHVAMHYARKKMQHEGRRVIGALPHGMSGGAIWLVGQDSAPIVVAIATSYDSGKKVMSGTRINPLLFRIRDELQADMKRRGIAPPE